MALIQCPECEGKVSDQAPVCPHCGFPLIQTSTTPNTTPTDQPANRTPQLSPHAYPGKPYHWSDRVPVALLLFWGGLLVGIIGGGGDIVDSLGGTGVQAAERTPIGWLAWAMVVAGAIWFVAKNVLAFLHYRRWKIDRLHQELLEEAEQAEQAAKADSPSGAS